MFGDPIRAASKQPSAQAGITMSVGIGGVDPNLHDRNRRPLAVNVLEAGMVSST
jgi:hypothetical protein